VPIATPGFSRRAPLPIVWTSVQGTLDGEMNSPMKTFLYGIVFGAAGAYLYVTNGAYLETTLASVLSWRNSAQSSVYGFGGKKH